MTGRVQYVADIQPRGLLHAKLQPRCLIGCIGESIVGNSREIEQDPALSLWLGNWDGKATFESYRLHMSQTPDGFTLLGWPDGISDADIVGLEIPTGVPTVYELDADLHPVSRRDLTAPA